MIGGATDTDWYYCVLSRVFKKVVQFYLAPLPLVPAGHQDPSSQLLSVAVAARFEQVCSRLYQGGLVQLDAAGRRGRDI